MICPMCENEVAGFHKRSHVLPDWMFKDAYSDNHKIVHINLNDLKAQKKQTATHASFWCNECETKSSNDDTYASLVLTDRSPTSTESKSINRKVLKIETHDDAGLELWSGIEFKRLQNFVFSVIIRGELFARTENRSIISQKHFDQLRSYYKNPDKVEDQAYPFLLIRSPRLDEHINYSFLPYHSRLSGHHAVLFRGGGFQFHTYTSSHAKPAEILIARANSHGEALVTVDFYKNSGPFKSSQEHLITVAKRNPLYNTTRRSKT